MSEKDNMMAPEVEIDNSVKKDGKIKKSFSNRNFKQGMYHSLVSVIVVAIVILLNLFVTELDINIDLTTEKVYTLTEETIDFVSSIEDEIEIYFLAKEKDQYEVLRNVVEEYDKFQNISVTWKDPEMYPQFASQYTDAELEGNDVIVVNKTKDKSRFVPFTDMYINDYSINYTTGGQDMTYTLDAEGQITSAIQYVTSATLTKMYVVSAHGEVPLGEKVSELVDKANVQTEAFDVLSATEVPDDCDILFINGPTTDISDEELTMYKNYLDNGGKAIFSYSMSDKELKNYNSLMEYYGVEVTGSVVLESEGNFLQNYATYVVSSFASLTEEISADFSADDYIISPIAQGLKLMDASNIRSTLTTASIVETSEDSYGKTDPSDNIEREEGDIEGPFNMVIQASDTYKDKTSKVVILATPYILADDWVDYYGFSNTNLFIDSIGWMSDGESATIAIPQRSLDQVYLQVDPNEAAVWGIITIAVIPLGILAVGFLVWYFRRKR